MSMSGDDYEILKPGVMKALTSRTCGSALSERRRYDGDTGKLVRVELYCYPCENAALWRLGRMVGK